MGDFVEVAMKLDEVAKAAAKEGLAGRKLTLDDVAALPVGPEKAAYDEALKMTSVIADVE